MHLYVLQHVPFEGPAHIAQWAEERGHTISVSRLYAGDALPEPDSFDRLVVMGGPMGVDDEAEHGWLKPEKSCIAAAIGAGKSLVGICLGAQLIAKVIGARVKRHTQKEIGWFPVRLTANGQINRLSVGLPHEQQVLHWHGDTFTLPAGADHLAESDACAQQAFLMQGRILGLQFHLETTPESLEALCANCADEVVPAPFVQTIAQMCAAPPERYAEMHGMLETLLDRLPVSV